MKRSKAYLVFWEMILLLASVLVFRSVWHFLDGIPLMNSTSGLTVSLAIGIVVCIRAFIALHKSTDK